MKTATVTKKVTITDKMRLDWICRHASYLEHSDPAGTPCALVARGCYWPQEEEHADTAVEEMIDLQLDDYIDAQIQIELNYREQA
jgi:hypothetical protein